MFAGFRRNSRYAGSSASNASFTGRLAVNGPAQLKMFTRSSPAASIRLMTVEKSGSPRAVSNTLGLQPSPPSCKRLNSLKVNASQKSGSGGISTSSITWITPLQANVSGRIALASLKRSGSRSTSTSNPNNRVSYGPC